MSKTPKGNFKKGTVELVLLYVLEKREMYGYQIVSLIKKMSDGKFIINESTLYPTLYKMLENKLITVTQTVTEKHRIRVYYHIEDAGRERLKMLMEAYNEINDGISKIFSYDELPEI